MISSELGRGWSRCLSWGEWDKLWRAGSSWAADRSYPAVISLRLDARNIAFCSSNLMVVAATGTLMAAPDTRYSARQFNFNQRMVLMILLYNFRLFNNTPIFKRCRGGDKNKFGLLLLRLGKGNSLTLNAVLPIICSSARVVVNDGGALIGCFPGGPPLRSRGWWRVMLLLVALGLPLLLARGQYRGIEVSNCDITTIRSICFHTGVHLPNWQHHRGGGQGCTVHLRGQQPRGAQGQ